MKRCIALATIAALPCALGFVSTLQAQPLVSLEMVVVGDPGNAADTTGFGAVDYIYRIGKYEVTIGQYLAFLNNVAATDPYGLYDASMEYPNIAGIARSGTSGSYAYQPISPAGDVQIPQATASNRPIANISWFDAARFCNWLHNGATNGASTETGAYTLNGATNGDAVAKNVGAKYWIPTENEWYKAAYFKGGNTNAGYWLYPTRSDSLPGNTVGSATNQANYYTSVSAVTQSQGIRSSQNYLTDVGSFTGSSGPYGTFDQAGNLGELNQLTGLAGNRVGVRGGYWGGNLNMQLRSLDRIDYYLPESREVITGFRVAASVPTTNVLLAVEKASDASGPWLFDREINVGPLNESTAFYRLKTPQTQVRSDAFGSGANTFTIQFVNIGNADNPPDTNGYGSVPYSYSIGIHEISQEQIDKATASGMANVTAGAWSGGQPAATMTWYETAAFVNWLNTNKGHQPAYNLTFSNGAWSMALWNSSNAWTSGGTNLYRHKDAFYFLPSDNEWYKAAYHNPAGSNYFVYPTSSSSAPTAVASGTNAGTAVYNQPLAQGPATVTNAGGLSPWGTMGQGGNVFESIETSVDGSNNTPTASRVLRGGNWTNGNAVNMLSWRRLNFGPTYSDISHGFRVASKNTNTNLPAVVEKSLGLLGGWQQHTQVNFPAATNRNDSFRLKIRIVVE